MERKRAANTKDRNNYLEVTGGSQGNGALLADMGCRIVNWRRERAQVQRQPRLKQLCERE